jgi:hypothetical protein
MMPGVLEPTNRTESAFAKISQSKKPGPCNRPGCWLQILNYKFLTNRLTSSFCEGNFIFRRLGKKNGCGNLNVENNITLLDESAGGTDSSCKFFTL